jgi:peptide-methionine (R)-S-oxide reductase
LACFIGKQRQKSMGDRNAASNREPKPAVRSAAGFDLAPPSPDQYSALATGLTQHEREAILEKRHRGALGIFNEAKAAGTYVCRLCGLPLFRSRTDFDLGTNWPSFDPLDRAHIAFAQDTSFGVVRTEIRCARCGGTLGMLSMTASPLPASATV